MVGRTAGYDAFVSYSYAPGLQTALERCAKPWSRSRVLRYVSDRDRFHPLGEPLTGHTGQHQPHRYAQLVSVQSIRTVRV